MLSSKYCEAFLAVAELGSFELAAQKLCITASAVTLRVQALEKQLGHILILRERPCRVTTAGQSLLEHLQHQRLMEDHLLQHLNGQKQGDQFYKVNIATNADALATWLLPSLQHTLKQEKITLNLIVDDQSQTHHLLEHGLVNACISSEAQHMKGCMVHHLGCMHYKMVATPAFQKKWFAQGVNRDSIRKAPAVIFNDKDRLHEDISISLFGLNMQSYPFHFIPSASAFLEAIELGLGFGLVPEMQIQTQLASGKLIELIPEARTEIPLYWHHWKQQSMPLQQISQTILQQCQHILI